MKLHWAQLPSIPDREGFAAPFAGVSNGALLVAGGANFLGKRPWEGGVKTWHDSVFALSSPNGKWRSAGRLPKACAYGVSVSHGGGVICAGGGDARGHFRDVYKLRWTGNSLLTEALPPLPAPCANACGALAGDVFYMAGGIGSPGATRALHTFWALDLSKPGEGWRVLPPWPGCGRMLAVAAAVYDEFYIIGGVALRTGGDGRAVREPPLRDAFAYSAKNGWRRIAGMQPRAAVAAASPAPVTAGGHIVVCSGDDGARAHLNGPAHPGFPRDALVYDSAADAWLSAGGTPLSRATVPTAEWGGRWLVINGERKPGCRSPEVWSLQFT
jgi:N-acetylneuraminic acid mutarotase